MKSTRHMSLAQFVATIGGIYYQPGEWDRGELENIRYHSKRLRGANAVFKKNGHPSDLLCIECMQEGYPVDENNFIDLLEQDTEAWGNGSDNYRVLRDTDTNDTPQLKDYLADLEQEFESAACPVCESPRNDPTHAPFLWEHDHLEDHTVRQLKGVAKAALYLTLFRFIYRH